MKKKRLLLIAAIVLIAVFFFLFNFAPESGAFVTDELDIASDLTLIEDQLSALAGVDSTAPTQIDQSIEATVDVDSGTESEAEPAAAIDEDGWYDSKDEVALYIHTYGRLPGNYITKKEAESLGWSGGGLDAYAKGKSIGGSHFGNYEGILPDGHNYTECDIDTAGKSSRGAKRIVFSDDGLIYYTDDHYETFTLLYGNEE
ncbi:MAG: ribonuclease [Clostridia bacterium]|nr:ribonuclease [Clostridia bacterium]